MKHVILAALFLLSCTGIAAQRAAQDTTLLVNGQKIVIKQGDGKMKVKIYESTSEGNTIENEQIFEGVYLNGQSTEKRTILDGLPFNLKKKGRNNFDPHASGFYLGYTQLSNDFFGFGTSGTPDLNVFKSWEIGANLFTTDIPLSRDRHWAATAGLGWGYRSFRLDSNAAFISVDGKTTIQPGHEETEYGESRLRYFYFRIPLSIEWQTKVNNRGPVFIAAGPEIEIRHGIKSMAKVNGDSQTLGNGMYVRPVGVNLLLQAGYDDLGIYLRYSANTLFQKNKGPEMYPLSLGLCWYW